jgi:hypothetical protein
LHRGVERAQDAVVYASSPLVEGGKEAVRAVRHQRVVVPVSGPMVYWTVVET